MPSSRITAFASAALAVAVVGCVLAGPSVANAAPPDFPDLNAFQAVDPAGYTASARGGGGTYFVTPDGLQCALPPPYDPAHHVSAGCDGPLPGLPEDAPVGWDGCTEVASPTFLPLDLDPYVFQRGTGCPLLSAPLLDVGQKITRGYITCVVGADRLTACVDPILDRGFVLRPSGSRTF